MRGTLYVVATPIGNLEDITLRALRVLREVDLIAAEDTRRTSRLLKHYAINTRTTSFHAHNEARKLPLLVARLERGEALAVVTDAGTPTVSDPGSKLVSAAIDRDLRVEAIPGPSAILAALAASGLSDRGFTFLGFPPNRSHARKQWLSDLPLGIGTLIFFEAPHRIRKSLIEALEILGDRQIIVGRELTKIHEQFLRGSISQVLERLGEPRGEYTVIVRPADPSRSRLQLPSKVRLWNEFCRSTEQVGRSRRRAITDLALRYGMSTREMYLEVEKAKPD